MLAGGENRDPAIIRQDAVSQLQANLCRKQYPKGGPSADSACADAVKESFNNVCFIDPLPTTALPSLANQNPANDPNDQFIKCYKGWKGTVSVYLDNRFVSSGGGGMMGMGGGSSTPIRFFDRYIKGRFGLPESYYSFKPRQTLTLELKNKDGTPYFTPAAAPTVTSPVLSDRIANLYSRLDELSTTLMPSDIGWLNSSLGRAAFGVSMTLSTSVEEMATPSQDGQSELRGTSCGKEVPDCGNKVDPLKKASMNGSWTAHPVFLSAHFRQEVKALSFFYNRITPYFGAEVGLGFSTTNIAASAPSGILRFTERVGVNMRLIPQLIMQADTGFSQNVRGPGTTWKGNLVRDNVGPGFYSFEALRFSVSTPFVLGGHLAFVNQMTLTPTGAEGMNRFTVPGNNVPFIGSGPTLFAWSSGLIFEF